jgi:hypothetical protein
MEPECRFGDVHCLTRYTPEDVVAEAERLVARGGPGPVAKVHAPGRPLTAC